MIGHRKVPHLMANVIAEKLCFPWIQQEFVYRPLTTEAVVESLGHFVRERIHLVIDARLT